MADRHYLEQLTKKLADEGKLIEAGWTSMRLECVPLNAPAAQLDDLHFAFMAGVQILFAIMLPMLEPGRQQTEEDHQLLRDVYSELVNYLEETKLRATKPVGSA